MDLIATKSLVTRLSVYVIALVFCTSASWTAVFAQDIAGGWIQMSGNTAHEVKMTVDDLKP